MTPTLEKESSDKKYISARTAKRMLERRGIQTSFYMTEFNVQKIFVCVKQFRGQRGPYNTFSKNIFSNKLLGTVH